MTQLSCPYTTGMTKNTGLLRRFAPANGFANAYRLTILALLRMFALYRNDEKASRSQSLLRQTNKNSRARNSAPCFVYSILSGLKNQSAGLLSHALLYLISKNRHFYLLQIFVRFELISRLSLHMSE